MTWKTAMLLGLLTLAGCNGTETTEPTEPEPTPKRVSQGRSFPGFTFLREETFRCGGQAYIVDVFRNEALAQALGLSEGKTDVACEFVMVPGGSFLMGCPSHKRFPHENEGPQQKVTVEPFLMARTEVTQEVWEKVVGTSPSRFKGPRRPVEMVPWKDTQPFLEKTGLRLPSEAEWELACRAGTTTRYHFGEDASDLPAYAWCDKKETKEGTLDVASKKPNAFGLFDMYGNVWEWCEDAYKYHLTGIPADGTPRPGVKGVGVFRGGGWDDPARRFGSPKRVGDDAPFGYHYLGFRPVASARP